MTQLVAICVAIGLSVCGSVSWVSAQDGEGPLMVRVRGIVVAPDDESDPITVIGGKAKVDSNVSADLDFVYFFTDHLAAELTLTFTNHDVEAAGTAVGDVDLGDVWLLPPTLTIQYHFTPHAKVRPYVGAGFNYVVFFGEDEGDHPAVLDIDYDNAFGLAIQAGFDVSITKNWSFNIDVKKVWLSTDVDVETVVGTVETEVDIDPILFGIGIAYRF